jgi:hypothetical protein
MFHLRQTRQIPAPAHLVGLHQPAVWARPSERRLNGFGGYKSCANLRAGRHEDIAKEETAAARRRGLEGGFLHPG